MQILHLDSSLLGAASASRALTACAMDELTALAPAARVVYRDLDRESIAHLDGAIAAGFRPLPTPTASATVAEEQARSEALVAEFLASDILVVGAPMVNFTVPSTLKAWIDRIAQPGRTFQYTPTGPVGLAGGKRVIAVTTRGGIYAEGSALAALDFQEPYLRAVLGFLGITDIRFVRAEGLSKGDAVAAPAIAAARHAAREAARHVLAH